MDTSKLIFELLKYKTNTEAQIKELRELSESGKFVLLSSNPDEKSFDDVIENLMHSINLIDLTINSIKKL